jgi:transcriptional regulator with XRE-family HTH domain
MNARGILETIAESSAPGTSVMDKTDEVRKLDLTILKKKAISTRKPKPQAGLTSIDARIRIGFHLRRERRLKKLRLKDVADATGLSVSLISKIETNSVGPSLSTLHRIARALDTSISALFAMEELPTQVVHHQGERPIAGKVQSISEWDGIEAEIMVPFGEGRQLEGFVFVMEPGGNSGGVLQHEGEECGYVLEGRLELCVGGKTYSLNRGDSFFFPSTIPHTYRNPGKVTARVVWINTPPTF